MPHWKNLFQIMMPVWENTYRYLPRSIIWYWRLRLDNSCGKKMNKRILNRDNLWWGITKIWGASDGICECIMVMRLRFSQQGHNDIVACSRNYYRNCNSFYNCHWRKVEILLKKKWRGLLDEVVIFYQDSAPVNTAKAVTELWHYYN